MTTRAYTVLGWVVWQISRRVAKRKMTQNKAKLGAVLTVLLVVLAGLAAAKASSSAED